uniref:Transposase (Putative), gypsy type n=1 Tax=Tanacetum cinerariifolium TaxID=118510 RepID=A0A6L2LEX7_TANCI|nr:hypothetical protein [Tanacetum cinerariifolium]
MSFSKRSDNSSVCYTKPLDSLKHWNDHFFLVDAFAFPVSFPWHTDKNISKDPLPKSTEFNVDHYVALVAHPAPFLHDDGEGGCLSLYIVHPVVLFVCAEIDLFAFIHVVDPTKIKIIERERVEGEKRLLDSTAGRVVPLLPIAPAYAEGDLKASVDKLFDEGGSTDQGDFAAGSGHDAEIVPVTEVENIVVKNVIAERPKHLRKKRPAVTDASGSSHPPKKLKGITKLLMGLLLPSVKVVITLILLSSLISVPLVRQKSAAPLPVMTDAVITTSIASAPFIPVPEVATKITPQNSTFYFYDSSSVGTMKPDVVCPSQLFRKELLIRSREINFKTLHEIREMDYHHLFTEFNIETARQACLNAEVRMRTEYCLSKRRRLESECQRQAGLLKGSAVKVANKVHAGGMDALKHKNVALENEKDSLNEKITKLQSSVFTKDLELKDLNGVMSSLKSQNNGLVDQNRLKLLRMLIKVLDDKVAKLDADLLEMALHPYEKFYPRLFTTISGQRWLLTRGQKLAIVKCLNSLKSLAALGAAISRAIEKGMKSGLSAGIDHEKADYLLLYELSSHKDASIANIMNMVRLESPFVDAPRIGDLQPDVKQMPLPIHRPKDQVVLGETTLSFALSTASTFGNVPAAVVTMTALSTTFVSTSFIPPITIDDYEIVSADGQEDA